MLAALVERSLSCDLEAADVPKTEQRKDASKMSKRRGVETLQSPTHI